MDIPKKTIEIELKVNDKQLQKALKVATLRAKLLNIELDRIKGIKKKKWYQFWK